MKTAAKFLLLLATGVCANVVPAEVDQLQPLIWRATKLQALDQRELKCLTDNIYYEARGEPVEGQIAVAQVTLNRVNSGRWGSTVCAVVYQKRGSICQFSWTCMPKSRPQHRQYQQAQLVAERVAHYHYTDVQYKYKHALHFHSTKVQPHWHRRLNKVKQTGNHIFYE